MSAANHGQTLSETPQNSPQEAAHAWRLEVMWTHAKLQAAVRTLQVVELGTTDHLEALTLVGDLASQIAADAAEAYDDAEEAYYDAEEADLADGDDDDSDVDTPPGAGEES